MKRILKMLGILALCFCVGTIVSELLVAAVVLPKLKLNGERMSQIAAIAQGADLPAKEEGKAPPQLENEEASYQDIIEARAAKYRNLELREQQLRNNFAQVQSEESKLADEVKRFKQLSDGFNRQLAEVRQNSTGEGMESVLQTLQSIQSKLAKDLLVKMLDQKEIDVVVSLFKQMTDKKRAKIIGEFKTDEEKEKLGEVLRRLREGQPEAQAVDQAQAKLETKKTP
jgi:hypothetical protein